MHISVTKTAPVFHFTEQKLQISSGYLFSEMSSPLKMSSNVNGQQLSPGATDKRINGETQQQNIYSKCKMFALLF